ncbi:D-serine deaminase-like pyridoxal phosphate-dependent protein [Alkalibacillus salilacus]|uniref:D-serine deaminase-like pyridoxal phosphate-dependent protein n=1 Tax=Alkalibacillus salilacus TaxID=284582 RepID=A0ABT9VHD1_9BACI|nr:D-serine deaminase-like pyridoxal phosphate-dependent protein [Alkalibacillus salilacus]
MNMYELETPALLIDKRIMLDNLHSMQECAPKHNVNLRPHTKTHKMPKLLCIKKHPFV